MPINKNKKTVLIVEDESFLRDLCSKKLTMLEYEVETAIDGKEAIEKINSIKPSIVLLDLVLPIISGFEVLERVRTQTDKSISGIPVIILSNLDGQEDIDRAIDLGANDYLIKSNFTLDEIIGKMKEYL
ncbi:MAG: response regulator [Patescibacteria group bacterium]|nr:response regulator [Patescibacteria group bacterium]